jgi:hypothetical protein
MSETGQATNYPNSSLMQAAISPEQMEQMREEQAKREAEYKAQNELDRRRAARASALEAALRCAQPGAHADAIIDTAHQFLTWLNANEA